jgi:hypothetical protein
VAVGQLGQVVVKSLETDSLLDLNSGLDRIQQMFMFDGCLATDGEPVDDRQQ